MSTTHGLATAMDRVPGDGRKPLAGEQRLAGSRQGRVLPMLSRMFGLDLRPLAAFRNVLGVIVDLVGRFRHARVHYTDAGVLPRERLVDILVEWRWSLMLINGSVEFVYLFFAATAVVAVAVIFGYRTRLAVLLLWLLVISIQVRNPYLQNGGSAW